MEILLHLWDELDELLGLAWHGAVALAADVSELSRSLRSFVSATLSRLVCRVSLRGARSAQS
jgi:hypothetical protein